VTASGGTRPARTIFLGSGQFAVPVVMALARHPAVRLLGVVTAPSDTPVSEWATTHGVTSYRPRRLRDEKSIDAVRRGKPDLVVLADYGQIVPAELLDLPSNGALNLHPSLLPRYRGASPIPATLLAGDRQTGVSLIQMDAGLDTGPIVAQRSVPVDATDTQISLEARLAVAAADLLTESLEPWLAGEIAPEPQSDEGLSMTRPLSREDGRLDPSRGIVHLDRQLRAYQPWPGTFIETDLGRVIVWEARPLEAGAMRHAGTLVALPGNRIALAASDGMLELIEVQPAGGRRMTGAELLRGRPALAGSEVVRRAEADSDSSA
jgi:methionyl-tRNA formyltransferase